MRLFKFLKEEIIRTIPAVIFFLITFNLINFTERLIEKPNDIGYTSYLTVSIGALIAGKFLLIINSFKFINAYSTKPLIYNITWKFFIYGIGVLLFRIIDEFLEHLVHDGSVEIAYEHIMIRLASPGFWAIQTWLLMLFVAYIVTTDFIQAIGKDKFKKMLFG